ncbi:DUF1697 domain-containing protein [Polaromonas sp. P1(28)-13]|nr:DUF1697 domain-containing protein [Polaromonas sp. P2-4]UUZ75601.1 DUF1697 domain-containing protein [Polaromonas sp. P1(28)-13]
MKYAAFFRNLNLGRTNCPTKTQFEVAFTAAGAESASSFLTNGTLVFSVNSSTRARKVLALACQALQAECGLKEPAYMRDLDYLADLVALDPFASVERSSVFERCVSFLHPESVTLPALPLESKRRDVEVLRFTDSEALSVSRKVGNTPGSPNAFLEKLLGSPVTTRNWNTVVRLVEKYA